MPNGVVFPPDYSGGNFANLIASLAQACGAAPRLAPLTALAPAALSDARQIVLLIVDGLGANYLAARPRSGALARHLRGTIGAVFPSTTASAITTSFTGATPLEHGLTGWYTYFSEAGCVAAPLPFRSRGDDRPLATRGILPSQLYTEASMFDTFERRAIVVSPRAIINSPYNRHHCGRAERLPYDDLEGLVANVEAAVQSGPQHKFVYAYWPEFDTLSHRHGISSPQAQAQFELIDAAFGELLERLAGSDTVVIATADHGFLDCPEDELLLLEDAPGLAGLLQFPLCGERRVAFCHVQPGRVPEFMARARNWLGERAEVRVSRELLDEGWFGPGRAHPRIDERIGDVTLVMRERYTVKDWMAGEARHLHIGNHGGTSDDEMRIPLVIAHP